MKLLYFLIIGLAFFSCHKSAQVPTPEPVQKHFNPADLLNLNLDIVPDFWEQTDSLKFSELYFPYYTNKNENNAGLRVSDKKFKLIGVAVFESKEKAIWGMGERINNVAVRIREGIPNSAFPGKWWYSDGSAIFVNQWNTIVEITILGLNYQDVKEKLTKTGVEIAKRVDKLSQ